MQHRLYTSSFEIKICFEQTKMIIMLLTFKKNSENLVYKKFYYIGPWNYPYYPPIFICENNKKGNKIMHCVDLFLSDSFEDMGFFFAFYLNIWWVDITPPPHQN